MGLLGATYASAYRPTVRDKVATFLMGNAKADSPWGSFVEGMVGSTGVGPAKRGLFGAPGVLDWTPLGLPFQADEAGRQIAQGHPIQGAANLAMALPIPAAKVAKGLGGAGKRAVQEAGEQAAKKVIAYHGSPHKFDRFSLDNIGTGEGAQAYGHGLYFAENEDVARTYRDQIAADGFIGPDGGVWSPASLSHMNVRVAARGGNLDAAIARAQSLLPNAPEATRPMLESDLAQLLRLRDAGGVRPNPGNMYQVGINADPEHFLDWDKPLSEQPEVAKRLGFGPMSKEQVHDEFDALLTKHGPVSNWPPEALARKAELESALDRAAPNMTGAEYYGQHDLHMSAGDNKLQSAEQSQHLNSLGIPGIKYLDAGSRGTGEGSRNYVVFNDKLIEIMKRYGIALPGAGLAYQAYQDQK